MKKCKPNLLGFPKTTYYRMRNAAEKNRKIRESILRSNAVLQAKPHEITVGNAVELDDCENVTQHDVDSGILNSVQENDKEMGFLNSNNSLPIAPRIRSAPDKRTCPFIREPQLQMECEPAPSFATFDPAALSHSKQSAVSEINRLASRHGITDECLEDILKLLHNPTVLYNRQDIPKTVRGFEKVTLVSEMILRVCWVCAKCDQVHQYDMTQAEVAPKLSCCDYSFTYHDDHYIFFNAAQILQQVITAVEYGFIDKGTDRSLINITLNTDGAPLFKGSKSSIWPVLGAVDGTYFRVRKQNIIMLGLFVGIKKPSKPDFNVLLSTIVENLEFLQKEGLEWIRANGEHIKSKIKVSAVMCDSVARPCVQNIKQFNGRFGCGFCYHDQAGHYYHHVDINQIKWRSHISHCSDIRATETQNESHGVKGESAFWKLSGFDMIFGFPPDVMHTVYLGVTKLLVEAWINSNYSKSPFYLNPTKQKTINLMLSKIKPPRRVSRLPRSLDNVKYYKAHELMMFLLYYSPCILPTVMEQQYFSHWLMLVRAIAMLTSRQPNEESILSAEKLLNEFSCKIGTLYGEKFMRFNVHLLLHLGEFVRRHGPLQNYSMSVFETFNMTLQKFVTSSHGVGRQICKRYFRDMLIRARSLPPMNPNLEFEALDPILYVPTEQEAEQLVLRGTQFRFYQRVRIREGDFVTTLESTMYDKAKVRDATCFQVDSEGFFQAKVFAVDGNKFLAIGEGFKVCLNKTVCLPHCYEVIFSKPILLNMQKRPEILLHVHLDNNVNVFFKFLNEGEAICE